MLSAYQFSLLSIVDLIAVAGLLTAVAIFFIRKKSVKLLAIYAVATIAYVAIVLIDELFNVPVARAVAQLFIIVMSIVLAVVYQSDFKVAFFNLTRSYDKNAYVDSDLSDEELRSAVDEIVRACQTMSKNRTGALIVIAPNSITPNILETGVKLEAFVSAALLEAIFNTRAPFHDGAVIVQGNKVLAAGCFLPLSQSQAVAKNLGTRHRAGIGVTEVAGDVLTIIASEETGIISIAQGGQLRRFVTPDRLRDELHKILKITPHTRNRNIN